MQFSLEKVPVPKACIILNNYDCVAKGSGSFVPYNEFSYNTKNTSRHLLDLKAVLQQDNIELDKTFYTYVTRYKEHLKKWNKIHNLTGAKKDALIDNFIYDAIYPLTFLPTLNKAIDIGTGAGFPGMILAFALPKTHFTLVEPLQKRASFLQFIKADLGLNNVTVENCRAESLAPTPYDLVTSRAVTQTDLLLHLSQPFLTKGTLLLFYKGEKVYEEVDPSLNYEVIKTQTRHYLLIES